MNIWAVCKDQDGTNGMLPVVAELRARGHHVDVITNGWAATNIDGYHLAPDEIDEELFRERPLPHLLLTSTCSQGGTGMHLIEHMRRRCLTIALQHIWGGALCGVEWNDPRYRPSHILSNDRIGLEIMRRAWPDFPPENIHEVGFPAMDRYAGLDVSAMRRRVREEYGLSDERQVVLFLGGGNTTSGTLTAVVYALNLLCKPVTLIVRPHPRMRTDFLGEVPAWDAALSAFRMGTLVTEGPVPIDEAIAASDLVIADASTAQITASFMGKPSISVLYESLGMGEYRRQCRGLVPEFPLVTLGCVAKAENDRSLCTLLGRFLLTRDLGLREMQESVFACVGSSALHAAEAIERIVQSS